jgi:hypothetical protein
VAIALGALLVVTTRLITDRSLRRSSDDLAAARAAFSRLMAARAEGVAAQLRLITTQPVFRARLAGEPTADETAIMTTMADDYPRQLNAEFCIVTARNGMRMAMPGWGDRGSPPPSLESAIRAAGNGSRSTTKSRASFPKSPSRRSASSPAHVSPAAACRVSLARSSCACSNRPMCRSFNRGRWFFSSLASRGT